MGEEIHSVNRLVLCISLVVALLSFTSYYINWVSNKEANRANLASSPFFIAHTLDPTVEGYHFTSWTRTDWIAWLARRQIQYENANRIRKHPRKPLNQKGLNTVLIASPAEVMNGFDEFRHPFNPVTHIIQPTFWSETIFDSFIFERNGQRVRVFKCPSMYIAVTFERREPVHLHAHSKRREMQGFKVKPSKDCKEIL